jgi:prepilin-type N-terminal cleavage/methylation domain-containing protein
VLQRLRHARSRDAGFTLIEPLVGLLAVGVLSGAAVAVYESVTTATQSAACQAAKQSVEQAAQGYYHINNSTWALDISALVDAGYLDKPPSTSDGYLISYDGTTGTVTALGACS